MSDGTKKGILLVGRFPFFCVMRPKPFTDEDPEYLAFIRTQPCIICGRTHCVAAHHQPEKGQGTMGGKCSDYRTIPLCEGIDGHHRGNGTKAQPGSFHAMSWSFWDRYGVDVEAVILRYNMVYFCAVSI